VPAIANLRQFADRRDLRAPLGNADKSAPCPMAHKIEVALGASETIRNGARRFTFMMMGRE